MTPTPPITYPPVGRCIYCGTSTGKLSREHIIPLGLGANHVLPQASCEPCANITKNFERACLRTSMGEFRIRQKMPTRRKKERPSSLPYTVVKQDNTVETIILPAHHLPSVLVLMKLIPPTLLSGGTPVPDNFNGDIWVSYQAEDLQRMRDIYKANY